MKTIYVKVEGMTCDHCKSKIKNALEKVDSINSVTFDGHIAKVNFKGKLNKNNIIKIIQDLDYYTDLKMISENKKSLQRTMTFGEFSKIIGIVLLIAFVFDKLFGFNLFNMIPLIDSKTTYAMLFVTGLLTSIHCVSMCGAINLVASTSVSKNLKKPILYNLGRLISYTLLGGIVGTLGSIFEVNAFAQGLIILIAAIFMFLMALNMMGVLNFSVKLKMPKVVGKVKNKGAFVIGILNGFMPCGPLQAMQVYALSTGSFFYGALSMFLFCLGTIPLMLFVGLISNFLNRENRKIINKISTILILLLSVVMLNRGLLSMGIDVSSVFQPNYDNYLRSEVSDDYQTIEFDLTYSGYKDIVVQKGKKVRMIINVTSNSLTGCNNAIRIAAFGITADLHVGINVIEFTPNKTGTFTYTCWMGMIRNTIVVVDNIENLGGK